MTLHIGTPLETEPIRASLLSDAEAHCLAEGAVRVLRTWLDNLSIADSTLWVSQRSRNVLQKNNIRPTLMGQMIGKTAAHDPTTDDDHPRMAGQA